MHLRFGIILRSILPSQVLNFPCLSFSTVPRCPTFSEASGDCCCLGMGTRPAPLPGLEGLFRDLGGGQDVTGVVWPHLSSPQLRVSFSPRRPDQASAYLLLFHVHGEIPGRKLAVLDGSLGGSRAGPRSAPGRAGDLPGHRYWPWVHLRWARAGVEGGEPPLDQGAVNSGEQSGPLGGFLGLRARGTWWGWHLFGLQPLGLRLQCPGGMG